MKQIDSKELATIKYAQGLASKVVGGLVGAGTALITVNPLLGAGVGATVAHTLDTVGREVIDRHLSARQEVRVGRAIAIAFGKLKQLEKQGQNVRQDGFFEAVDGERSAGDEVTEATLFAAMNSAEERKVDFIATLLANIATTTEIDEATAHLLVHHAERLSFRAYMLLKIIAEAERFDLPRRAYRGDEQKNVVGMGLAGLELELYEFVQDGLMEMKDSRDAESTYAILGSDNIDPGRLYLTSFGHQLHNILGLADLPEDGSFDRVVADLRELARTRPGETVIDGGSFDQPS